MKNLIYALIFLIISIPLLSQGKKITIGEAISDLIYTRNFIAISTYSGSIKVYNNKTLKKISSIKIPAYKTNDGTFVESEIFHLTHSSDSIYALAKAHHGKPCVFMYTKNKLTKLIDGNNFNSNIVSIAATSDHKLLLGMLSNELICIDLKTRKTLYKKQINPYAFSCFVISEDQQFIFISDESGIISKVDVKNGNVNKRFRGQNLDNVLSIDISKLYIITGGKDRRVSFYNQNTNENWHVDNNHFVTMVSISPNGKVAAWFNDLSNEIVIYSTVQRQIIKSLNGHLAMVTKIIFNSNEQLISCDENGQVLIWNLN